ncbi:MAG TPA: AraC family transcriptional regulator [Bacteroidales bacterium]|nr:AraC family transcriptional regulator [Bacteroidales bacterium]
MKPIFLIAAFNAFFFTILLVQKKPKSKHDNILTLWLIYLGLFIGTYSFYSHNLFTHFHLLSVSFISLFYLHGAFLYLYVSSLVSFKKNFNRKNLLHLVPFGLFNVYIITISFFPDIAKDISLEHVHSDSSNPPLFLLFLIITALSGPIYFALTIRLFKKLDINIFNNFSYYENINLVWLRKLVYIFGIVWTVLIIITTIHHVFNLFSPVFCTDGLFLTLSVFVILIGYFGFKQKVLFSSDSQEEQIITKENKVKYASSRLTEEDSIKYINNLMELMQTDKPFLRPNLTILELASDLNITTHSLSQIINENYKLNFFDFINKYRVEEVKEKIADVKYNDYSLLGIALDCGFNSKSAFNRIFKKFTGQTPSEFKNNLS